MNEQTPELLRAIEDVGGRIDGVHERLDRVLERPATTTRSYRLALIIWLISLLIKAPLAPTAGFAIAFHLVQAMFAGIRRSPQG